MSDNNIVPFSHRLVFLPQEMVTEILLRVPSKSLIRFKSACKSWCTLFSSSRFMASHLLPDRDHNNNLLLVMLRDKISRDYTLSFLSDDTLDVVHSRTLNLPPLPDVPDDDKYSGPDIEIVGPCCNGLMCLAAYNLSNPYIVLWKPSTGYVKVVPNVPPPGATFIYHTDDRGPYHGFGYDADSQDYKVIRINLISYPNRNPNTMAFIVEVYSVRADSWRAIDHYDMASYLMVYTPCCKTYTNGIFAWAACVTDDDDDALNGFVWFRMSNESFRATRLPPDRHDGIPFNYAPQLLVLNDMIGLIMYHGAHVVERFYHVWALLELGVEDSWTRLFTLGPLVGIERPIWFCKNRKMIMKDDEGDLVLCDPFTQEMKYIDIIGGIPDIYSYVQIVSIQEKYIF